MYNSKLYSILKDFDKYEQNRLRKYVNSPYFNKSNALSDLLEIFLNETKSATEATQEIDKVAIWEKLKLKKEFDDVRFRKLQSDLLKLIEGFLAQQTYDSNPLHQATYLIEAVKLRKIEKMFNGTMKTARRLSAQQVYKPANYFYYQYQIEKNYYDLSQQMNTRESRFNVEEIANNLDAFYLAEKLKYYCAILNQQYLVSHEYKMLFIDEIIEHIKKYKYEDIAQIAIYFQMFLTLVESDNEDHFYNLKEQVVRFIGDFPIKDAEDICSYSLNVCIRFINTGQQKFLQEYFDLHSFFLEKNVLYTSGITYSKFKNACVMGLRLGKYEWTEKFIHNLQSKLPEASRENAVTYNLATVYFYQKKYGDVIKLLQEVEYEDVFQNLDSKSLLLATYYEMEEIDPLYSLFDSFRAFLNRHKSITKERRQLYLNLIKYTKKLTKIRKGDKAAVSKIKDEMNGQEGGIVSKNWLTKKIAEKE